MEKEDSWTLDTNLKDVEKLFAFNSINFKTSFCKNLLTAINLPTYFKSVQSFSKCIKVKKSWSVVPEDENPAVYVFAVDVVCKNGGIAIVERNASYKETFFNLSCLKETPVLLVHSKSIPVVEALFRVYEKYEYFLTSKSIVIHHVFEENEDLCKKIGVQKLKAFDKIVRSLWDSVPVAELNKIVHNAANISLSEYNIRRLCYNVVLKDGSTNVGTTDDRGYHCRSPFTVQWLKEQLVNETLKAISESFASEICQGILRHIESKVRIELETELLELKVNIYPEIFATFSVVIGTALITLFMPYLGIIVAMATFMATAIFSVDVNSKSWRAKVANQISETVSEYRSSIENGILSEIIPMCIDTKEDLRAVSDQINDRKQRIGFPDQETLAQEWKKSHVFPYKEAVMKKYPSVLNYLAGKIDGKSVIKVFLRKEDKEAETFFRENCSKTDETELEFINVSNLLKKTKFRKEAHPVSRQTRTHLQEIIRHEEDKLTAIHSNIVGIRVGRIMRDENEFGDPCIVLYCLDKRLIPYGEKEIPKSLKGNPIDIREEIFMFGFCDNCQLIDKGCSIGRPFNDSAGSVGFLVKSNCQSKEWGFLTAAHVAYENLLELKNVSNSLLENSQEIVHPSYLDSKSNNIIGRVTKASYGSLQTSEYSKGIDAAFVHVYEPEIRELSGLNIVNEDDVQCERTTLVSKKGRSKKVTIGILSENTISIKVNNIWFKNCFCIYNYNDSEQFFVEGDSGSGVFLIDSEGEPKKALGIAFAFSSTETCVCDIRNIVQAFDIAYYEEP